MLRSTAYRLSRLSRTISRFPPPCSHASPRGLSPSISRFPPPNSHPSPRFTLSRFPLPVFSPVALPLTSPLIHRTGKIDSKVAIGMFEAKAKLATQKAKLATQKAKLATQKAKLATEKAKVATDAAKTARGTAAGPEAKEAGPKATAAEPVCVCQNCLGNVCRYERPLVPPLLDFVQRFGVIGIIMGIWRSFVGEKEIQTMKELKERIIEAIKEIQEQMIQAMKQIQELISSIF